MNKIASGEYAGQQYKIHEILENGQVEVFLPNFEDGVLRIIDEICLGNGKVLKILSRKDFYLKMKDPNTSKNDMIKTVEKLMQEGKIVAKDPDALMKLFTSKKHQSEIIDEFHKLHKETDDVEFKLDGNHRHLQQNKNIKKPYKKKNFKKNKQFQSA